MPLLAVLGAWPLACCFFGDPIINPRVSIVVPVPGMLDPTLLYVAEARQRSEEPTTAPCAPLDGALRPAGSVKPIPGGFGIGGPGGIGTERLICVQAWYDTNGNHQIDRGDYVGKTSSTALRAKRGCMSSDTNELRLVLKEVR